MLDGALMIDIEGTELTAEDIELLTNPAVCGLILFSRNYRNIEQLDSLIAQIRAVKTRRPLLIAVDHEGGRVQRFKQEFTEIPAAALLGKLYDNNKDKARKSAHAIGWRMAAELRCRDIDFSFAPVIDIDYKNQSVIGDRSFHSKPSVVYELAFHFIEGMKEAGMSCVVKHFPGHGGVTEDSHVDIPVDERFYEQIYDNDLIPFRRLIMDSVTAIMPAHVIYRQIDAQPAGFSTTWLDNILRQDLGFLGAIISDDLNMQGASVAGQRYSDRVRQALRAGCDVALFCNNRPAVIEILSELEIETGPVVASRIARMAGHKIMNNTIMRSSDTWQDSVNSLETLIALKNNDQNLELL